jgi:hypothetical protein
MGACTGPWLADALQKLLVHHIIPRCGLSGSSVAEGGSDDFRRGIAGTPAAVSFVGPDVLYWPVTRGGARAHTHGVLTGDNAGPLTHDVRRTHSPTCGLAGNTAVRALQHKFRPTLRAVFRHYAGVLVGRAAASQQLLVRPPRRVKVLYYVAVAVTFTTFVLRRLTSAGQRGAWVSGDHVAVPACRVFSRQRAGAAGGQRGGCRQRRRLPEDQRRAQDLRGGGRPGGRRGRPCGR